MDGSLVSDQPSSVGVSKGISLAGPFSYTEVFYRELPQYMAIGMTPDEYWNGDCTLVTAYRQAEDLKVEQMNQRLWLQGVYVYDAILRVSPILHAFAKRGTKPQPYAPEPYAITEKQAEMKREAEEEREFHKGLGMMQAFMNKSTEKR